MAERRWQCVRASFDGEEPLIPHWFYKGSFEMFLELQFLDDGDH